MYASRGKKNKKAISEIVSYVLLISLAIAMAAAAYAFIRPYAEKPLPQEECPESISIVLENYSCDQTTINFTLKNRGLFNVTGLKLKVINDTKLFEYDFLWLLPTTDWCNNIAGDCLPCGSVEEKCLGVGESIDITAQPYSRIYTMVIYPVKLKDNVPFVCTSAVVKVPVNCTGTGGTRRQE